MISIEMDHNENEINNNNVEHPEVFLETLEQDLLLDKSSSKKG